MPEVRNDIVAASMKGSSEVAEAVAKNAKSLLKKMGAQATSMGLRAGEQKVKRLVDKMLFNYRNIGFIHLVFPEALILHTVRDPMDTLLSCFTHKFDDKGLEWAFDAPALVEQYVQYLRILAHFRRELPGRVLDVHYEELVSDPEPFVRTLVVDKLGLEWDDRYVVVTRCRYCWNCRSDASSLCLCRVMEFHTLNRTVHTHSMQQVRKGIYSNSIGKWRKFADQLKPIRKLLRPALSKMLAEGDLPFPESMNWELDPHFPYEGGEAVPKKTKVTNESKGQQTSSAQRQTSSPDEELDERVHRRDKEEPARVRSKMPQGSMGGTMKRKPKAKVKGKAKLKAKGKVKAKAKAKRNAAKRAPKEEFPVHRRQAADHVEYVERVVGRSGESKRLKDALSLLMEQFVDSLSEEVVQYIPTVQKALPYPFDDPFAEEVCAVGVLLFNLGRLQDSIELLEPLIQYKEGIYSAYLGIGSAYAMSGQLSKSLEVMNRLVSELTANNDFVSQDVYERRAQVVMALGDVKAGIEDLTKAISVKPTSSAFVARGTAYMRYALYLGLKLCANGCDGAENSCMCMRRRI